MDNQAQMAVREANRLAWVIFLTFFKVIAPCSPLKGFQRTNSCRPASFKPPHTGNVYHLRRAEGGAPRSELKISMIASGNYTSAY